MDEENLAEKTVAGSASTSAGTSTVAQTFQTLNASCALACASSDGGMDASFPVATSEKYFLDEELPEALSPPPQQQQQGKSAEEPPISGDPAEGKTPPPSAPIRKKEVVGPEGETAKVRKTGSKKRSRASNPRASSPKPKPSKAPSTGTTSISAVATHTCTRIAAKPAPTFWAHREFPYPASLLKERSLQRAHEQAALQLAPVPGDAPHQICGLSIPKKKVAVCGKCGSSNDDSDNTILLCDGEGCGQEFHMKSCCVPPLLRIPKGLFFCFDCSTKGTTKELEEYFSHHETQKDKHEWLQQHKKSKSKSNKKQPTINTRTFADALLHQDVLDELKQRELATEAEPKKNPRGTTSRPTEEVGDTAFKLPFSELMSIPSDSLVGKPVRLYCPFGNAYHNGRIVDTRQGEPGRVIALIRFPSGKDHRKQSFTTWIDLEEHCLAVATDILWGLFGTADSNNSAKKQRSAKSANPTWVRAKLWRRSARELVPIMHLLDEELHQIRYRDQSTQSGSKNETPHDEMAEDDQDQAIGAWGLVETFGTGAYELLNLNLETRHENPLISSKPTENTTINGLVKIEMEEQKRIKKWKALPLHNSTHVDALKSQDELALGPLGFATPMHKQFVRPSSLVQQGVDRSMILDLVSHHLNCHSSRDISLDMSCGVVDSLPSAIQCITDDDAQTS